MVLFLTPYLKYFPRLKESRVLLIAEREQDVYSDPAVLVLKHNTVPEPGGPRGAHGAAAALPASILDQTLLPAAEGLHVSAARSGCVPSPPTPEGV